MEIDLDKRYQTIVVLWFAQFMSIGLLLMVALVAAPEVSNESSRASKLITLALGALGGFLVVTSFVVKRKLLERSVEQQDLNLVQKAFVVAGALCEVPAIIGLIERFVIGNQDYYLLFLLAGIGMALHFPRREHLMAASFKKTL